MLEHYFMETSGAPTAKKFNWIKANITYSLNIKGPASFGSSVTALPTFHAALSFQYKRR